MNQKRWRIAVVYGGDSSEREVSIHTGEAVMAALDQKGHVVRPIDVRGRCIEKFGAAVQATQWDYILLHGSRKKIELDLRNLFDPDLIKQSLKVISEAQCVEDLAALKFAKVV